MASSFCFFAISVCAATAASLDSLSAAACATLMFLSLSARAIAALFLIFTMLSIPRFSMTSLPSTKFWTLKLMMSSPIAARSGSAFSLTRLANFWRSDTISSSFILPTISRTLPSRTSLATPAIYSVFLFKKFSAASRSFSGSLLILMLTVASTLILM